MTKGMFADATNDLHVQAANLFYRLRDEIAAKRADARLYEAWDGLDRLLAGAWGRESLEALGGGKTAIERAHDVLTEKLTQIVFPAGQRPMPENVNETGVVNTYDLHWLWDKPLSDFIALIAHVEFDREAFTITRRGKRVAVVLPVDEYECLRSLTTPITGMASRSSGRS